MRLTEYTPTDTELRERVIAAVGELSEALEYAAVQSRRIRANPEAAAQGMASGVQRAHAALHRYYQACDDIASRGLAG